MLSNAGPRPLSLLPAAATVSFPHVCVRVMMEAVIHNLIEREVTSVERILDVF